MTALVVVILQPILGVAELRLAISNFISPVFFFVVVMLVPLAGWVIVRCQPP